MGLLRSRGLHWLAQVLCVVVLLAFAGSLYVFSGLPKPWAKASPDVVEKLDYDRFCLLAKLIRENCAADGPLTKANVEAMLREQGLIAEEADGQTPAPWFVLTDSACELGRVIIRGQFEDKSYMVWAVTDKGAVIKVARKPVRRIRAP